MLRRGRKNMRYLSFVLLLIATSAFAASPFSINNDDSCDVTVAPAATLLLPYFEVDLDPAGTGQTTIFTVTNVFYRPQVAHVTLWTDHGYPVMAFNLYLGGYDVQSISIRQILVDRTIASPSGTSSNSPVGALSARTNPNLRSPLDCAVLPGVLPESVIAPVRDALTKGVFPNPLGGSCSDVGDVHTQAIGYATIDVVASCTNRLPTDPLYYTNDLLFDNVLIGDYQQIAPHPAGERSALDAGVNPLVHIRAVPEGGGAGSNVASGLPYTFYDRYTPASNRTLDRRQPLPATFAARFVQGGPGTFRTNLNIWREGVGSGSCTDAAASARMDVADVVRFDEHENPFSFGGGPSVPSARLPATSSTSSSNSLYPFLASSDLGGWFYLNLNNGGSTTYSANVGGLAPIGSTTKVGPRSSQNWVTVTMFSTPIPGQTVAAEFDAASLGNGCSPAGFESSAVPIAPAGGVFACPPGTTLTNGTNAQCTARAAVLPVSTAAPRRRAVTRPPPPAVSTNNDDSCDIKVGPAATLLLPRFEVDVSGASGRTTLFTVTNVTRYPQIAHVTLWSDYAYPVMTFNLFLGGYDVQSIDLADVLIRNTISATAGITPGSIWPTTNPNLRAPLDCGTIPGIVLATLMAEVRKALTTGGTSSCNHAIGGVHANAIGYATIDVVASCTSRSPNDPLYYTNDLLFDNVLIGDYQQLGPAPAGTTALSLDATGNPMVHIRAVPEGGGAGSNVDTRLPYTFYDRYTPASTRTFDRRQPLPSLFAARYIQGGPGRFATNLTIWREGVGIGSCADASISTDMVASEIGRFDEHENPDSPVPCSNLCLGPVTPTLNASSSTSSGSYIYPSVSTGDVGGWFYLNLNNQGSTSYSVTQEIGGQRIPTNARTNLSPITSGTIGPRPSQNWVTVTQFGNAFSGNRLTGEFDAAVLGNGCSPAVGNGAVIAPAGGVVVCPPGTTLTDATTQLCKGTNINPRP